MNARLIRMTAWICAVGAGLVATRVFADGELDTSFGNNGVVNIALPDSSPGSARDAAIVNGAIEVAGFGGSAQSPTLFIARLALTGSVIGAPAIYPLAIGKPTALIIDPASGDIYVIGAAAGTNSVVTGGTGPEFQVLDARGALIGSYGTSGGCQPRRVLLDDQHRFVSICRAGGGLFKTPYSNYALRLSVHAGALSGGPLETWTVLRSVFGEPVITQDPNSGAYYVGGTLRGPCWAHVTRLNGDSGDSDTTYGVQGGSGELCGTGPASGITLGAVNAITLDSSGDVVIGGAATYAGYVARLDNTGFPDATFGAGGAVTSVGDEVVDVRADASRRIYALASASPLRRFKVDGTADVTFGSASDAQALNGSGSRWQSLRFADAAESSAYLVGGAGDCVSDCSNAAKTAVIARVTLVSEARGGGITTTVLNSSATTINVGQSLTLTATVTGTQPSGQVTFSDGSALLSTANVAAGGANYGTSSLSVGSHTLTATYSGDSRNAPSTSQIVIETVNPPPPATTTALESSATTINAGESVTFTATVNSATGDTPSGTVTFMDGATALGSPIPLSQDVSPVGAASFTTRDLPAGTHSITAAYGGDVRHAASKSAPLTQAVVLPPGSKVDSGGGAFTWIELATALLCVLWRFASRGEIPRRPHAEVVALVLVCALCQGSLTWAQPLELHARALRAEPATRARRHATAPSPASPQARRPAAASPAIAWVQCPPDAQALGAACGELPVPLDRSHPQGAKINIYFEIYSHSSPGPAVSAIFANAGGPGGSTTALRFDAVSLFAQNFDVHDFVLIDDRGRGQSTAIDCAGLQHGTEPFDQAEAECVSELGQAASRYGTGDVALDTEAVRAALGYEKVDYWGGSYGGEDVTAYATRFGEHVRSIVLDAPQGTPGLRPFVLDGAIARAVPRAVRLDCLRSPTCAADHADPEAELVQLVRSVRSRPLRGYAPDANGNTVAVTVDEGELLHLASYPTGKFVSTGELLAAGNALAHGDALPLLRLAAEDIPFVTDYGDPTLGSQGDYVATMCVDAFEPWDWDDSVPERMLELAAAVAQLSPQHFAPFSRAAGTSLAVSFETQCLWWQKPTPSSPVTPPHAAYPNVPTLVLVGDLDTTVPAEEVRQVAALFPASTYLEVAEAGHETIIWTACAANLQSSFIETLQVGDTHCTLTPETVWPALGRFTLRAADASAAPPDPRGANLAGDAERRVVTVAVATAIDALKRSTFGEGSGVGLRAGTFQTSFDESGNQTTTLSGCAFARDVTVSGSVVWGADLSLVADLNVSGPGTGGGTLHVEGSWQAPGPVGRFRVSGALGGRRVAALVPEA